MTMAYSVPGEKVMVDADAVQLLEAWKMLNERERQVVILLHSGLTKVGDVAGALGYKNHSPVSKRLALIRKKAADYFYGEP